MKRSLFFGVACFAPVLVLAGACSAPPPASDSETTADTAEALGAPAPTGCTASITDACYVRVAVLCSPPGNGTLPGDTLVLERKRADGGYDEVTHGSDLIDGTPTYGRLDTYRVCTRRNLVDTCGADLAIRVPWSSCGGGATSPTDPGGADDLNPTCGRKPLPPCKNLSNPTH